VKIIDLSAPITPSHPDVPAFQRVGIEYSSNAQGGEEIERMFGVPTRLLRNGEGWATDTFTNFGTHSSTHVDAPLHYNATIQGQPAQSIDQLPLEWFFAPGVVLDFRHRADGEAVSAEEVQTALHAAGHILKPLDIVLIRTGRDAFYGQPDYWVRGPGVSAQATEWLYAQGVRVMGIDAWGWDAPLPAQAEQAKATQQSGVFWAAHQLDLAYSQIERLMNLGDLPATGFRVACFPLKLVGGSAGPARVVAILD